MSSKRIVICISGAGTTLQAIIDKIATSEQDIQIVLVVSSKANAKGLTIATQHGIPTAVLELSNYPNRIAYGDALHQFIVAAQPSLIVLAGFMLVLDEAFVNRWYGKLINIHPSLLPKYRGLHTHKQAFDNGDDLHGTTVHFVSTELDAGPIIAQATCSITDATSVDEVKERVQALERDLYPSVIMRYCTGEIALPKVS